MDEQIKKPISRTIIIAIEKAPSFPYVLHPPPQYVKDKSRRKDGGWGWWRKEAAADRAEISGTFMLRGDNAP